MNKLQRFFKSVVRDSVFTDLTTRGVNLTGSHNIFGTMGAGAFPILSHMDFIPEDGKGNVIQLTGQGDKGHAQWIGLSTPQMQFWAYVYCSPLSAVIDRLAEADTNGIIRFVDDEKNVPIKNANKIPRLARLKKLFNRPNPWQTWEEFDAEQLVLCKVHGCCPVWAIGGGFEDKTYTTAMVNLNKAYATPVASHDDEEFDLLREAVKGKQAKSQITHWKITILGNSYEIPSKDVFIVKDGFIGKHDEYGLPLSKINGMDFSVSNIIAAMEANNVILKKKGPLGVFSYDPAGKDMAGTTPYDPKAKAQLQADLRRYGLTLGQLQYIISKLPVKFVSTSFPLKDLMTVEIIRGGIDFVCDRFGYPAELMSGKNATYENRNSSEKWLYNNNVIPFSLRRMKVYNDFFGLEEVVLRKDYKHLPVLQEDIVKESEAGENQSNDLLIQWEAGMITWNQWQQAKKREPVAGMDIYYPEYIKKFPLMNKNKPADGKDKKPASKDSGTEK